MHLPRNPRASTGSENPPCSPPTCCCVTAAAERQGWRVELLSEAPTTSAATKEAVLRIEGARRLRCTLLQVRRPPRYRAATETGPHPRQAAPAACCPARCLEAAEAVQLSFPAELRIDTFRASNAGSQHINKDRLGRARDAPATGLTARCQGGPQPATATG